MGVSSGLESVDYEEGNLEDEGKDNKVEKVNSDAKWLAFNGIGKKGREGFFSIVG